MLGGSELDVEAELDALELLAQDANIMSETKLNAASNETSFFIELPSYDVRKCG